MLLGMRHIENENDSGNYNAVVNENDFHLQYYSHLKETLEKNDYR